MIFPVTLNDLTVTTEVLKLLWTENSCNNPDKNQRGNFRLPFSAELNGFNNFPIIRVITLLSSVAHTVLNY